MAKKNKDKETTITDYYDLKKDQMDELVSALKGESSLSGEELSTKVSDCTGEEPASKKEAEQTFDPYKRDLLSRIPVWVKAFFIKFWFAGAVCYFVNMGLGVYITSAVDLLVLDGVVLGIIVDCLINPLFRMMETGDHEYDPYVMFPFPFKVYWTFFANIAYYIVVFIGVNYVYMGINLLLQLIDTNMLLALEPLLFGLFVLIVDMTLIGIKDLVVYLIRRAANKKNEENENV